ncbi:hypothetical protein EZS27_030488, partial [termite gut metagenome]
ADICENNTGKDREGYGYVFSKVGQVERHIAGVIEYHR